MSLTLLEMSQAMVQTDALAAMYISLYAYNADILSVLPFENISGNAVKFNQINELPDVGFRAVNEAFSESTGSISPVTEGLTIAGGELDVDKFLIQTGGAGRRTIEERGKLQALSLSFARTFIKGDQSSDPREFNGIQARIIGDQKIAAGTTSGGDALSLAKLDEAIDACENPTHIAMSKAMRRRLTQAARNPSVSGYISYTTDVFGRQVTLYNDLPILIFDKDNYKNKIIDFNEANPGGGANVGTSLYVLSLGDGNLTGIQSDVPQVTDLGEIDTKPFYRTRIDWNVSIALWRPEAAVRLWGIKDAAVTV